MEPPPRVRRERFTVRTTMSASRDGIISAGSSLRNHLCGIISALCARMHLCVRIHSPEP